MSCDLKRTFEAVAQVVPDGDSSEPSMIFSSHVLPVPPSTMQTNTLLIQKRLHEYNACFRADNLWIQGSKETLRYLGLLILATVFHPTPTTIHLHLLHPHADIRELVIEFDYQQHADKYLDYVVQPSTFTYTPRSVPKYPWKCDAIESRDLPCFWLTYADEITVEDWDNRTIIEGFGTDRGHLLLAEFLLNISQPQNQGSEYALEGDAGMRGVGRMSAEAHFFLPGSLGWDAAAWPEDVP